MELECVSFIFGKGRAFVEVRGSEERIALYSR
jgi:hypothetical protein